MRALSTAILVGLLSVAGCDNNEPPTRSAVDDAPTLPPDPNAAGDDIDTNVLYAHGPLKQMMAEQVLMSVAKLTGHDFGTWDITNPNNPDPSEFILYCQAMGGCPDHVGLQRSTGVGLVYVLTLDKVANAACIQSAGDTPPATGMIPPGADEAVVAPGDAAIESAINWQYKHLLGADPSADELIASKAYFQSHLNKTDPDTGNPTDDEDGESYTFGTALRGHCFALVTSAKFLYH